VNTCVEPNVPPVGRAEAEHETNKDTGPFTSVDVNWLSKLNTATVEVEESKVLLRNDEGLNKTAIGLVDKNLPVLRVWCQIFFEKGIANEKLAYLA
jgi:hypothetical protein